MSVWTVDLAGGVVISFTASESDQRSSPVSRRTWRLTYVCINEPVRLLLVLLLTSLYQWCGTWRHPTLQRTYGQIPPRRLPRDVRDKPVTSPLAQIPRDVTGLLRTCRGRHEVGVVEFGLQCSPAGSMAAHGTPGNRNWICCGTARERR